MLNWHSPSEQTAKFMAFTRILFAIDCVVIYRVGQELRCPVSERLANVLAAAPMLR